MHRKFSAVLSVTVVAVFVVACSSNSSKPVSQQPTVTTAPARVQKDNPPPVGSELAKIEKGMRDTDVLRILGRPSSTTNYVTGKAWIPFYYGPDTRRTDYIYSGLGRVVFSRNRYSGDVKVIRVTYNPNL